MASAEHELVVKVVPDMTEVDAELARRQQPSVGRIVHYVSHGTPVRPDGTQAYAPECRAAIVTGVRVVKDIEVPSARVTATVTEECALAVLNPTGMFFNERVPHDEDEKRGGSWHWPERV